MKRFWGIVLLAAIGVSAYGQQANQARVDAIWNKAVDRINGQMDIWYDDGDFPRVVNICKMMYALYPSDYEVATNLGWMLENIQRWDEALAVYIKFKTENPKNPDAAWPEANFYFAKKAFQKIPSVLEPTLKMATRPHPNSYRTLAHAYERMNQLQDSKRVWQAMLTIYPKDEPAKINLARVEKKLKTVETPKTNG